MLTIKLGNLLKIELGDGTDSPATSLSPALRKLNEALKEIVENLLNDATDETTVDPTS